MKKKLIALALWAALPLNGCAIHYYSAAMQSPAMGADNKLERVKYKILGDAVGTAKGYYLTFPFSLFGFFFGLPKIEGERRQAPAPGFEGNAVAGAAAYDAMTKYPGADMLIGVRGKLDRTESWGGIFVEETAEIRGKAIQIQ